MTQFAENTELLHYDVFRNVTCVIPAIDGILKHQGLLTQFVHPEVGVFILNIELHAGPYKIFNVVCLKVQFQFIE